MPSQQQDERIPARLYLVTPVIDRASAFTPALRLALEASDIAAVLLRLAPDSEGSLVKTIKALAPVAQDRGAALLLDGHPDLVARAGADGAHLTGIDAFTAAAGSLKPDRIAGAGGLLTRHDAMLAAEGGADYVMFGEPDAHGHRPAQQDVVERLEWWAQVFQIPCVGFAAQLDEVDMLARTGAEFVALGPYAFDDPRIVADAARQLAPEPAR
jgi:thiamine-phosphate pyrophosphorylase